MLTNIRAERMYERVSNEMIRVMEMGMIKGIEIISNKSVDTLHIKNYAQEIQNNNIFKANF